MQGCIAPSEVPGVSPQEASVFGSIAEDIIYADFHAQYGSALFEVFRDANNPAAYLFFLARNNPHFVQSRQMDYYGRLRSKRLGRIPDFLVHRPDERAFYEVKPDSTSGMAAGIDKVGTLTAVYRFYGLPYVGGTRFQPRDHTVALLGSLLRATLKVRRVAPGLIVYKLCLDSEGTIELATLAVLLRYIVREVNRQRGSGRFEPVDLEPAFRNGTLGDLARTLGLTLAAGGAGAAVAVGWRHFWKAVVKRFAIRGAAAATLAAADGPLPIGDLVAAGLAVWTIVDIIRLSPELWREAGVIARQGA